MTFSPKFLMISPDSHSMQTEEYNIGKTSLPSDHTYQELQNSTEISDAAPSLRAAPPGGTPIGGVPIDAPCILSISISILIYIIYRKLKHKKIKL